MLNTHPGLVYDSDDLTNDTTPSAPVIEANADADGKHPLPPQALLKITSHEDTHGQGMCYGGFGIYPNLSLQKEGEERGGKTWGEKKGCECSGEHDVGLSNFATWVCVCGFDCRGV